MTPPTARASPAISSNHQRHAGACVSTSMGLCLPLKTSCKTGRRCRRGTRVSAHQSHSRVTACLRRLNSISPDSVTRWPGLSSHGACRPGVQVVCIIGVLGRRGGVMTKMQRQCLSVLYMLMYTAFTTSACPACCGQEPNQGGCGRPRCEQRMGRAKLPCPQTSGRRRHQSRNCMYPEGGGVRGLRLWALAGQVGCLDQWAISRYT